MNIFLIYSFLAMHLSAFAPWLRKESFRVHIWTTGCSQNMFSVNHNVINLVVVDQETPKWLCGCRNLEPGASRSASRHWAKLSKAPANHEPGPEFAPLRMTAEVNVAVGLTFAPLSGYSSCIPLKRSPLFVCRGRHY